MGMSGSKPWKRSCHNHSPKVMKLIMSVVNNVIDKALKDEIEAAIRPKLNHLSEDDLNNTIRAYFNKDTKNILVLLKRLALLSVTTWGDRNDLPVKYTTLSQVMHISSVPSLGKSSASWSSQKFVLNVKLEIGWVLMSKSKSVIVTLMGQAELWRRKWRWNCAFNCTIGTMRFSSISLCLTMTAL